MKKRKNFFKFLLCVAVSTCLVLSLSLIVSASEGAVSEVAAGENIFTEIYRAVTENSADILSLLSFAASVTVAIFYKYALSPLIKGALDKISNKVSDISGEHTKEYKALSDVQARLLERDGEIEARLSEMSKSIQEISDPEKQRLDHSLLTVMQAQVNMLYEIFQSSALPVYQKEAVGNMINEMRMELSKNENADK